MGTTVLAVAVFGLVAMWAYGLFLAAVEMGR